jgi:hypothetical protein
MHVLFRGKLPNKTALSRAMADLGFPFTIRAGSLERQRGFMPMHFRREGSGVEFDVYDERAVIEEIAGDDFDPSFERCANFRWGGEKYEMLCGLCAAAALAKLVGGMALDGESGELLSPDQAIAQARRELETFRKSPDPRQGTRPADLRRYLQPLLRQRSDLVLIGRMLVIRPVRHFLRGAFLEGRHSSIRIRPFMKLLCHSLGATENWGRKEKAKLQVWEPHFAPLLIDTLANEIFEEVGKITTLEEFAAALPREGWFDMAGAPALHLAGQRERAAAAVESIASYDNRAWKPWWESQRDLLAKDIGEVCAIHHAREAAKVKEMKLERIWQPSPFPAELPQDRRKQESDEPLFTTTPWPERPDWLLANLPDQVGDVRFAKGDLRRNGEPVLVVPLSREQAEERHHNWEPYVLGVRPSDKLVLLIRWGGRDRLDPLRIAIPSDASSVWYVYIGLHGLDFDVSAIFPTNRKTEGARYLDFLAVARRGATGSTWEPIWRWSFDADDGEKAIRDYRGDKAIVTKASLTDSERERLALRQINFGEFEPLLQIVVGTLRSDGFGEVT